MKPDYWPSTHKDILDAETFMKVKFTLHDSFLDKTLAPDSAYIGTDKQVVRTFMQGSNVFCRIATELGETVRYELRLKKRGYKDIVLDLKAKIDYKLENVTELDLGAIELSAAVPQAMITLEWQRPFDLDSHLFVIENSSQDDHMFFFKSVTSDRSAALRKDIVDASNAETTTISPLYPHKFYLFSVYNYSKYLAERGVAKSRRCATRECVSIHQAEVWCRKDSHIAEAVQLLVVGCSCHLQQPDICIRQDAK